MNFPHSPIKQAEIIDLDSGRVIVTYPIDVPAQKGPHAKWEMMERAWHYAVEDGITRHDARWKYSVRIVPIDWGVDTKPVVPDIKGDADVQ